MRAAQTKALRDWLIARLPFNRDDPGTPLTFEPLSVYRAGQTKARANFPICTFRPLAAPSHGGVPERIAVKRRYKFRLTLDTNPAGEFSLLFYKGSGSDATDAITNATITITPGVSIAATVALALSALQALEGSGHLATYTAVGTDSIDIEGIEVMTGQPILLMATTAANWLAIPQRAAVERWRRDLIQESVAIRVETVDADSQEARAYSFAEKLAEDARDRRGWRALAAAGVGMQAVSGPINATGLIGGAAKEVATLTLILNVTRYRFDSTGTIESTLAAGTLEGSADLSIATLSESDDARTDLQAVTIKAP